MTTNFPAGLDDFVNPAGTSLLTSPDHAGLHTDVNDAVEALEAKVGVDGSLVTSSLDYKFNNDVVLKSVVDAKGDLLVGTAADTVGRLAVGTANGQVLTVDSSTSSGLVWAASGDWTAPQTVETKNGAYTIASGDVGKIIRMDATANFTVDSTTGFAVGQKVDVFRIAAGACDVVQGSGATVSGTPGLKLRAQFSAASIVCVAANVYYVVGDLSA